MRKITALEKRQGGSLENQSDLSKKGLVGERLDAHEENQQNEDTDRIKPKHLCPKGLSLRQEKVGLQNQKGSANYHRELYGYKKPVVRRLGQNYEFASAIVSVNGILEGTRNPRRR